MKLLSRDDFRRLTLQRNDGVCCVPSCQKAAVDAHHILNRNLFTDSDDFGGYFIENGAQLCLDHHYDAELTLISVEELRTWCGITFLALPKHFLSTTHYDCWGNIILSEYSREAGPMFSDEGCQKALKKAGVLWMFVK